jgi:hypothetical protein
MRIMRKSKVDIDPMHIANVMKETFFGVERSFAVVAMKGVRVDVIAAGARVHGG